VDKREYLASCGIIVSATHFMSIEGAKAHDYPSYYKPDGDGKHIQIVRYQGENYLSQPTKSDYGLPIPYQISGK